MWYLDQQMSSMGESNGQDKDAMITDLRLTVDVLLLLLLLLLAFFIFVFLLFILNNYLSFYFSIFGFIVILTWLWYMCVMIDITIESTEIRTAAQVCAYIQEFMTFTSISI